MRGVLSLRGRLTAIILGPLLIIAAIVGLWQLNNARQTAADVFDKSLLAAALAVATDVAVSGGDALSPRTRDLLSDTSGGPVFYHVYAPDGVIVAGYATPPAGIPGAGIEASAPYFFDATYHGQPVHGVRLQNQTQIDGFAGVFTTTVWQQAAVRSAFVSDLSFRSSLAIAGLIASVALIVWFGVRLGLRPLTDLEAAIASRSSDELTPIRRAVPTEVGGIVGTLNRLFGQVTQSMTAQSEFISNAAHQLRNPIAGVLSLAEAVEAAPDFDQSKARSRDLLTAARETADLSQKLLLLERAKAISPSSAMEDFDLDTIFAEWAAEMSGARNHARVSFHSKNDLGRITADQTMLQEAIRNLIDNALHHGGPDLREVRVTAKRDRGGVLFSVQDDGIGIAPDALAKARERFGTVATTSKSGLGISIVEAIAQGHNGSLELKPGKKGLTANLRLRASGPH